LPKSKKKIQKKIVISGKSMRICPELVTHLVVKLFNVKSKGKGRIRGIFGPLLKNLHFGICVRDDLKTKRNGRKNCSDFYFGCLATKIIITLNLH
jgi:hypothetical protein